VHVRDLNLQRASDPEIFVLAAREDRVLVSADTDFAGLLALGEAAKPSLILFRGRPKQPSVQADFLLSNLPSISGALEAGAVVVLEESRIRVRRLPFGISG